MSLFHCSRYRSVSALVESKQRQGETISVVIPALNEAPTIGRIVACIREELIERVSLVDQIVVMDGSSVDQTAEVAARAGARVYVAREVLPESDVPDGKGCSMWKALSVVEGSIVVYIDGDIVDFDPRFVTGLVGPLLERTSFLWSKAYYQRPLRQKGAWVADHGGRVTEILVRPLLSLWYPGAASMRQPLSGECAFRTEVLKAVPFSSGYGVELQLLLGMYRAHGMDVCAQVDMEIRRHRNRPVTELSRMAFAILRTGMRFLESDKRVALADSLPDEWIGGGGEHREQVPEMWVPPFRRYVAERDGCRPAPLIPPR